MTNFNLKMKIKILSSTLTIFSRKLNGKMYIELRYNVKRDEKKKVSDYLWNCDVLLSITLTTKEKMH